MPSKICRLLALRKGAYALLLCVLFLSNPLSAALSPLSTAYLLSGNSTASRNICKPPQAPILIDSVFNRLSNGTIDGGHSRIIKLTEKVSAIGFSQTIEVSAPIFEARSEFQHIQIYGSSHFGKVLVLDDVLQITERDGDSYNEMMAHMPMMAHPAPKKVLIIGGGDGYVLSEVLKHPSVEHVDHVDLDEGVIKACEKYFSWGSAWADPRVKLRIEDGALFVRNAPKGFYDVIVQDSSDPYGDDNEILPSSVLYSEEHFSHLYDALSENGVLNFQAESLAIPSDVKGILDWRDLLLNEAKFEDVRYGTVSIPTYPTGQIGFLLCSKNKETALMNEEKMAIVRERFLKIVKSGKTTTYYHPRLQKSSFDIPLAFGKKIYGESFDFFD